MKSNSAQLSISFDLSLSILSAFCDFPFELDKPIDLRDEVFLGSPPDLRGQDDASIQFNDALRHRVQAFLSTIQLRGEVRNNAFETFAVSRQKHPLIDAVHAVGLVWKTKPFLQSSLCEIDAFANDGNGNKIDASRSKWTVEQARAWVATPLLLFRTCISVVLDKVSLFNLRLSPSFGNLKWHERPPFLPLGRLGGATASQFDSHSLSNSLPLPPPNFSPLRSVEGKDYGGLTCCQRQPSQNNRKLWDTVALWS